MLKQTPSQTVGPYFAYAWTPELYGRRPLLSNVLTTTDTAGERIRVEGVVTDGDGAPIRDCVVEIWQADAQGRVQPGAAGFGRCGTTEEGLYRFDTVKPGATGDGEASWAATSGWGASPVKPVPVARSTLRPLRSSSTSSAPGT